MGVCVCTLYVCTQAIFICGCVILMLILNVLLVVDLNHKLPESIIEHSIIRKS